jgi:DUF4097 and DUF4098 domain-containing protein YvlB
MRFVRCLPALGFALVLLARPASAEQWDRHFNVGARPHVTVEADDGHVTILTWDRPEVSVHVESKGWHVGSQLRLDARQEGSEIHISARTPRGFVSIGINNGVRIEVSMPREADLEIRTGDGGVEVAPLTGHLDVSTGDGGILVRGAKGDIRVATGDGGIDGEDLDGRFHASTQDGHIRVSGRFDVLDLMSGDGRVIADVEPGSVVREAWTLHTGDGSQLLRLPASLKANLEAQTGDGRITMNMPVEFSGDWSRSHLRGTINGGGGSLRLHSGDGSIRVEKR